MGWVAHWATVRPRSSFGLLRLMVCGLLVGFVTAGGASAAPTSHDTARGRVVVVLPAPTGAYPVGTTSVDLTDRARADPWYPNQRREVLVRVWYPAADDSGAVSSWMPPDADRQEATYLTNHHVPRDAWTLGAGQNHEGAPARSADGPYPVLVYSPGMDDDAGWNVAQAEDLASHGYVVAEINHTHEAFSVPFPDGRTEHSVIPLNSAPQVLSDVLLPVRVADARFVLDQLTAAPPDWPPTAPSGLADSIDGTRIGKFGHSLGGSTTAQTMHDDSRIRAGVDLDGPILGSVLEDGLRRPLLMLASDIRPVSSRPGWEPQWPNNSGLKVPLRVTATEHMAFDDQQVVLPQLVRAGLLPAALAQTAIGTIDPTQSMDLQRLLAHLLSHRVHRR